MKDIAGGESGVGLAVRTDASGTAYVAGRVSAAPAKFGPSSLIATPAAKSDFFISVYDREGKNLWYQAAGGAGTDQAYDVATDSSGNVYAVGAFENSARFSARVTLTSERLGASLFLAKYDPKGLFLWATKPSGAHNGEAHAVQTDAYGSVYVAGYFYGTANFGATTLSSSGNPALFVAKYDADGKVSWATQSPGSPIVIGLGFTLDTQSRMFVTGYYRSDATLGGVRLPNLGGRDIFVTRLDPPPVVLSLDARLESEGIVVRWPRTIAGYQLEQRTGFARETQWIAATNAASAYRDKWTLTNAPTTDSLFYRLRRK